MKHRKLISKIIIAVLCILLTVPQLAFADDWSQLEGENSQLQQQVDENKEKLDAIKESQGELEDMIDDINDEISQIESTIAEYDILIKEKADSVSAINTDMVSTQLQINELTDELNEQYRLMKLRIQYSYEHFGQSYWTAIFSANSFSDAFKMIQYAVEVIKYNNKMKEKCAELVEELMAVQDVQNEKQAALEAEMSELNELSDVQRGQQELLWEAKSLKEEELEEMEETAYDIQVVISEISGRIAANQAEIDSMIARFEAEQEQKRLEEQQRREEEERRKAEEAEQKRLEEESKRLEEESKAEAGEDAEDPDEDDEDTYEEEPAEEPDDDDYYYDTSDSFIWPLSGYSHITSYFGYRGDDPTLPQDSNLTYHNGIDIYAPQGTPIRAVKDGVVVVSDYSYYIGYYIVVYHGDGIYSEMHHMCQMGLPAGTTVSQYDTIGYTGATGYYCYGAHLHFAMNEGSTWLTSDYVNPLKFY